MRNFISTVLILTLFVTFSCDKEDSPATSCSVVNPAEELPWLKSKIESWEVNSTIYTYMYVEQGTYLDQTVFIAGNCCPFCDSYFPVYNCEGDELDHEIIQHVTNLKLIWKPENSLCTI